MNRISTDTSVFLVLKRTCSSWFDNAQLPQMKYIGINSSGHLVPSDLGLAYILLIETIPFSKRFVVFPDCALRTFFGTFSILLSMDSSMCTSEIKEYMSMLKAGPRRFKQQRNNLKLVRDNLNYGVLETTCRRATIFLWNDHSLCAHITSDECHAWFH